MNKLFIYLTRFCFDSDIILELFWGIILVVDYPPYHCCNDNIHVYQNTGQLGTRQTRHQSNSAPVDQIRHLLNSALVELGTC